MAHWIIEDKGFGGVVYKCSNCGEVWNDYYCKFPKDFCACCGEDIDDDAEEYIEENNNHKENNIIVFPQTIGNMTYYSKTDLFEWVETQQQLNKKYIKLGWSK